MKHTLLLVIFNILLNTVSFGQLNIDDQSVQIKPIYELNKPYHYEFIDNNISVSINDTTSNVMSRSLKTLKLIDKNEFAYKMQLTNGRSETNDPTEFYRDFVNNSQGIVYEYSTNLSGEFLEVLNSDKVEKQFLNITDKLSRQKNESVEYIENISNIVDMIQSKTYIPYVFEQEIKGISNFNGQYLKMDEKYLGKSIQENIFGFPISSSTITYLKDIDKKNKTFTLISDQNLSKEDFEKLWEELAYYMLNEANLKLTQEQVKKEIKKYSDTLKLTVSYKNKYDHNAILLQSDYIFSLNIGSKKTINYLTIKLID